MAKAYKFGDNIDTDAIIPARYLNDSTPSHLAAHCMEDADKSFAKAVKSGDFIVGGSNFGCGSSREHAPLAIKSCGVQAVIAKSFARIFFRNCINIGLTIIECDAAVNDCDNGDEFAVDIKAGKVENLTKHKTYAIAPYPEQIRAIIARGGLL